VGDPYLLGVMYVMAKLVPASGDITGLNDGQFTHARLKGRLTSDPLPDTRPENAQSLRVVPHRRVNIVIGNPIRIVGAGILADQIERFHVNIRNTYDGVRHASCVPTVA